MKLRENESEIIEFVELAGSLSHSPTTTRKPLAWFKPGLQIREDLGTEDELRCLGETLTVRQWYPLIAMADGELIAGFRRLKAAWLVGLPDLDVTIIDEPLSDIDKQTINATENIQRKDISPFERWRTCDALKTFHPAWTASDIANLLKVSASVVTKWLSPSKCTQAWRDALREGRVGITDCYQASLIPSEQQDALLAFKFSGASRDALSRAVHVSKRRPESQSVRTCKITVPLTCGTKIVISGDELSLSDVVEKLATCLEAARKGIKEKLDPRTWQKVMRDKSIAAQGEMNHV